VLLLLLLLLAGWLRSEPCAYMTRCSFIICRYNNVSLGFTILSIALLFRQQFALGGVLFVLSLCFKQMSLYHAPAFFFYLLALCIKAPSISQGYALRE